jgi:glycosyltransferase involved in cell wall biosynthesis
MSRLRILILAPNCNPDGISIPLVSYSHAAALAKVHDVSLVVGSSAEQAVKKAKGPFRSIEVVHMPKGDRLYNFGLGRVFKYNFASQALTAFAYPFSLGFEWSAWRQLRKRIYGGEFDVVLRLLPLTAVLPSPFAFFLRNGPIPFVIGPINGGLPFVRGFSQAENQREWISSLRNVYRFLPFARSTYSRASAIITASSHTYKEFSAHRDKLFFVPENGIDLELCSDQARSSVPAKKLKLIFVGGLIPCKGCDLALRGAASVLRSSQASFTILGDGPERSRLEELARSLSIEKEVSFRGWVSRSEVIEHLRDADVLVFPSVRDFGAGVVFEALANGVVPVVVDFGGPGDIVHREVGYKVPLTNEADVAVQIEKALIELAEDRDVLHRLRKNAVAYARENLTWEAKAQDTTKILDWVLQRGPRPNLLPPKILTDLGTIDLRSDRQDTIRAEVTPSRPLVSILIPAYNAEEWIAETLQSAVAQTWQPKEIIVVDDGSTDRTLAIARKFELQGVRVVANEHVGAAATRNKALSLSRGEYIQYLDADDLLAPDKITRQMEAVQQGSSKRTLYSGSWAEFMYRHYRSDFVPSALWCDLAPVEWLIRKMQLGVFMQTGVWLVSRELAEAAGPWDTRLLGDDDGEYFCRVLLASDRVRFVPESRAYYRRSGVNCLSYIGLSDSKMEAQMCSMRLHIQYVRSLEDSQRVLNACIRYLQNWLPFFYPNRPDLMKQAQDLAVSLGGSLITPEQSWKFALFARLFGATRAKRAKASAVRFRWSFQRCWEKMLYRLQGGGSRCVLGSEDFGPGLKGTANPAKPGQRLAIDQ